MDQPKTREEKGKGKGAKTKAIFNQKTIRLKEAIMAAAAARTTAQKKGSPEGKRV